MDIEIKDQSEWDENNNAVRKLQIPVILLTDYSLIETSRPGRLTNQLMYLQSVVKGLFLRRNSAWFKQPVDKKIYNIPNCFDIITKPMDLGTIQERLKKMLYWSASECIEDIEFLFSIYLTYSMSENDPIRSCAEQLRDIFRLKLKGMPQPEVQILKILTPFKRPVNRKSKKETGVRKKQKEVVTIDLVDISDDKDNDEIYIVKQSVTPQSAVASALESFEPPQSSKVQVGAKRSSDASISSNKRSKASNTFDICKTILDELMSPKHKDDAWVFEKPIHLSGQLDPVGLDYYFRIIAHPICLDRISNKLDVGEYDTVDKFKDDVHLMLNNCFVFNKIDSDVYRMGKRLEKVFQELLKSLYVGYNHHENQEEDNKETEIKVVSSESESGEDSDDEEEEKQLATLDPAQMMEILQKEITSLWEAFRKREYEKALKEALVDETMEVSEIKEPKLEAVIDIVMEDQPTLLKDDGKEFEIDFEILNTETLHKLRAIVPPSLQRPKLKPKYQIPKEPVEEQVQEINERINSIDSALGIKPKAKAANGQPEKNTLKLNEPEKEPKVEKPRAKKSCVPKEEKEDGEISDSASSSPSSNSSSSSNSESVDSPAARPSRSFPEPGDFRIPSRDEIPPLPTILIL